MGRFGDPRDVQLTQASLQEAQLLGLKVVVWNWPETLEKLIRWGVGGVITDDPGRLIALMR